MNLVSLHVQGGTTSKIVRWLTANTLASLGDKNLAYEANDISTDKGLVGTSKIIAVVGETAKLELFSSLDLTLEATISLAGNAKKVRHHKDLSFIIVTFSNA